MRDNAGFAAAGASKDKQRPFNVKDRFSLRRGQLVVLHYKECKNQRLKSLDSLLLWSPYGLTGEIKIMESSTKISIFYWIVFIAEQTLRQFYFGAG